MPALLNSRVSAVILSRGSTWSPQPWEPPYLLPDNGQAWPTATASCVFYDTSGGTLATVAGTVTPTGITFTAAPAVVDLIPNGSNFEVFLTVSGSPYQIRYGKVIRREAQFTTQPGSVSTPLAFTDSWPTLGIRSTWVAIQGSIFVADNSGESLPNGLACNLGGGALRWYTPLTGDTVTVKISTLNQHNYGVSSTAKLRVILCADIAFSSFLAVEFEASSDGAGVHSDLIHFCTGTGPQAVTYRGSSISNVVADGDSYTVRYDNATGILSVYKGTSTSPLGSWTDSTHIVPHGPGYRYLGVSSFATITSYGIQPTTWQAQDAI